MFSLAPSLLATGIGKVVRKLGKKENEVGKLAGKLVIKWKKLVLRYNPPPTHFIKNLNEDKEESSQLTKTHNQDTECKKISLTERTVYREDHGKKNGKSTMAPTEDCEHD